MQGQERLAETTLALWRRGGPDTLATALPYLTVPDGEEPVGLCTALRFLLGLTPPEIAVLLALSPRDFASGAEIFAVAPLPRSGEFAFAGYAPRRPPPPPPEPDPGTGEMPARAFVPAPPPHPIYPPAFGPPRWSLAALPGSRLRRLASVGRERPFAYETRLLPPSWP